MMLADFCAQILAHVAVGKMIRLTNNPTRPMRRLDAFGLEVIDHQPIADE
jgi:GTP cyclohydrolase II